MPRPLMAALGEYGIQSRTAIDQGWENLTNGRLVEAAVSEGFTCLLTRDQLFGESASRALSKFPQFAVVLVMLPQMKASAFIEKFKEAWRLSSIQPLPGKMIYWPE